MAILVDGVLVTGPFALTIRDPAGTDVALHGGLRNVRDVKGLAGMAARVSVRPRIGRSGSKSVTRHREDRPVTVELQFLGEDTQHALEDYYTLSRAVNSAVDTDRLLRWTLGTYNLESLVRAESIEPPALVAGRILETQIGLRAMDPRAYGQTERSVTGVAINTTATVTNAGSVETPARFVLHGPLTGAQIIERLPNGLLSDDRRLRFWDIPSGVSLTIDVDKRTVVDATGADRYDLFKAALSRWFYLAPGSPQVHLLANTGTGTLDIHNRDAFQ